MTTYRLFPATSGPASPAAYSGPFVAGVLFKVTQGGMWLAGYDWWVPGTNGDTGAQKFCLWTVRGAAAGTLIPAATVTSGTLTAGAWNTVTLSAPVPLSIGATYIACTGWTAVHGFPDSDSSGAGTGAADSYGAGGHAAGITQGPLFAFSGAAFSKPDPMGNQQGVFSTAGADPAVTMPFTGSNDGNFWISPVVTDTAPPGYSGSYRLWPNRSGVGAGTFADSAVNYVVATEIALSQACTLNRIWYYSPPGVTQQATRASVWDLGSQAEVAVNASPSWSGAAGSGWVSCSFTGTQLSPGSYRVSVYNGASPVAAWSAKDASTAYWATGEGANGITWGPISAPGLAAASLAYVYNGTLGGSTPPFTDGTQTKGQCTFAVGPPDRFPYLYVTGLAQNYWVDAEVTPVVTQVKATSAALVTTRVTSAAGVT